MSRIHHRVPAPRRPDAPHGQATSGRRARAEELKAMGGSAGSEGVAVRRRPQAGNLPDPRGAVPASTRSILRRPGSSSLIMTRSPSTRPARGPVARATSIRPRAGGRPRARLHPRRLHPPGGTYDVVFDAVAKSTFGACRRVLRPRGTYVTTLPSLGVFFGGAVLPAARLLGDGRRAKFLLVWPSGPDFELLGRFADEGKVRPSPLPDLPARPRPRGARRERGGPHPGQDRARGRVSPEGRGQRAESKGRRADLISCTPRSRSANDRLESILGRPENRVKEGRPRGLTKGSIVAYLR